MQIKGQKGYLTIIIAMLILTVAFSSLVISYIYSTKAMSVANTIMSMQSYYIAQSGLERAVYDITVNHFNCSAINGTANYTNFVFPNAAGAFTVTGTATQAGNTLSVALTNVATTLSLTSSAGFATYGTVLIDSELINYTAISGNNLTGLMRGVGGSTAAAHAINAPVAQDQCLLSSIGGVPSLTSPVTKRTIVEILQGSTFSLGQSGSGAGTGAGSGGGTSVGVYQAGLIVGGSASIGSGGVVTNGSVTASSPNFPGSTIMAFGGVVLNGTAVTQVSNGSGTLVNSSVAGSLQADVSPNNPLADYTTLWNKFFTQSKATVQASANQTYTSANINGATGQLIWTTSLTLTSATTIGSATAPVILIVDGNINTSGSFTLYGLLYVTGSVAFNSTTLINGALAMEGPLNMNGSVTVNLSTSALSQAGKLTGSTSHIYSFVPTYLQESFA
ncbi:MAG TPA: hypothetical protein VHM20_03750 [Gammaproteobacteria bacterium]|jgi:hypothetical protein|nr:hypothetical protein [Gammaproteobacteria bacterium]